MRPDNTGYARDSPLEDMVDTMATPAPHGSVLSGTEFISDVLFEMSRASKRIYLQAFAYRQGPLVDKVTKMLAERAQDGVDTRLNIDYYSKMLTVVEEPDTAVIDAHMELKHRLYEAGLKVPLLSVAMKRCFPGQHESYSRFRKRVAERDEVFEFLSREGVKVTYLNEARGLLRYMPFYGRNHVKLIVADEVAYLGGLNLDDPILHSVDFMLKIKRETVVNYLASLFEEMQNHQLGNGSFQVDNDNAIVLDDGTSYKSACYDYACRLVRTAQDVSLISGYLPAGQLRNAFKSVYAHGTPRRVIFGNEINSGSPYVAAYLLAHKCLDILLGGNVLGRLNHPQRVHARLLIADDQAYTGSHNFSLIGNYLHTAEICLATKDACLVKNLRNFYDEQYEACQIAAEGTRFTAA